VAAGLTGGVIFAAAELRDDGDAALVEPTTVASPSANDPTSTSDDGDSTGEVTPSPTATSTENPTLTPDVPDLVVQRIGSRDNHVLVVVANEGAADAEGPIEVSVDGGQPHRIDVGKPLRPGDSVEQVLDGEFVQRRARVTVEITTIAPREENAGNNVLSDVVEPDVPNDLELRAVARDQATGELLVTIANLSPIPLVGTVLIGVRQTVPSDELLLRDMRSLDVDVGGENTFRFVELIDLDLSTIRVILSTDAITDADPSNNTVPR
jgi:hypothetical protein